MINKIHTFILVIGLLFSSAALAQKSTTSLYSGFGLGEIVSSGFGQNFALGGAGIALGSNQHLNPINPASYAFMMQQSVIFEFQMSSNLSKYALNNTSVQDASINFDALALGFSPNKWWSGSIGFKPLTNVGYSLSDSQVTSLGDTITSTLEKGGGLSKLFIGNAFKLGKYFTAGFNFNYITGKIEQKILSQQLQDNYISALEHVTLDRLEGFTLDFGLIAAIPFQKNQFTIGATYSPARDISTRSYVFTRRQFESNISVLDTLQNDTISYAPSKYPSSWGIGVGLFVNNKYFWTVDLSGQNWAGTNYPNMQNSFTFASGLEITPDFTSTTYVKRIRYRMGFRYNKTNIQINNTSINDIAVTLGFGFPIKTSGTIMNIGAEFGRKGTTDMNLVQQDYVGLNLNFTMHDKWFIKRKFD